MPAKSLRKLATASAISGIKYLHDVGECPYRVVRPILLRLGNPQQLREIENACPQIKAEDEEIWRSFIIRDFSHGEAWLKEQDDRIKKEKLACSGGQEPKALDWWKLYQRIKKKADKDAADHAATLKAVLDREKVERDSQMTTIDSNLKVPPSRGFTSVTAHTPKTQKSMSILQKARREASIASAGRRFTNSPSGMIKQSPPRTVFGLNPHPNPRHASPSSTLTQTATTSTLSKKDAQARRERALAQDRADRDVVSHAAPATTKRSASGPSPFIPKKRRLA